MSDSGTRIEALYRYPVKGLSAEPLERATVVPGGTIPLDRAFALEVGTPVFDPAVPAYLPKIKFLMLMRDEKLARLKTRLVGEDRLDIAEGGTPRLSASVIEPDGIAAVERFFADYLGLDAPHRLVRAQGHSFSDVAMKCLSLVNLATVEALEERWGRRLDPLRFRANVYLGGLPAFFERDLVGARLMLADAIVEVVKETSRCAATNVEPATGVREGDLPGDLLRDYGHMNCGVYARVVEGGEIRLGAACRRA